MYTNSTTVAYGMPDGIRTHVNAALKVRCLTSWRRAYISLPPITVCSKNKVEFHFTLYNLISYTLNFFSFIFHLLSLTVCIIPYSEHFVKNFLNFFFSFVLFVLTMYIISKPVRIVKSFFKLF